MLQKTRPPHRTTHSHQARTHQRVRMLGMKPPWIEHKFFDDYGSCMCIWACCAVSGAWGVAPSVPPRIEAQWILRNGVMHICQTLINCKILRAVLAMVFCLDPGHPLPRSTVSARASILLLGYLGLFPLWQGHRCMDHRVSAAGHAQAVRPHCAPWPLQCSMTSLLELHLFVWVYGTDGAVKVPSSLCRWKKPKKAVPLCTTSHSNCCSCCHTCWKTLDCFCSERNSHALDTTKGLLCHSLKVHRTWWSTI